MNIQYNKVTWYSITFAVVLYAATFLIAFYLGLQVGVVLGLQKTEISISHVQSDTQSEALPTNVGQCFATQVKRIETRLVDSDGTPVPGSGSAIAYTNGGYQVSYDTIEGIENSYVGDSVSLCLLSIPTDCPPGDQRGKFYGATNLRTGERWELPDAEHMCGGA